MSTVTSTSRLGDTPLSVSPSKSLPPYTPSQPAPLYSDLPNTGEQSLQYTPRVGQSWFLPDGVYTKRQGKTTILLYNQEDNAQTPEYRQSGIVSGCITLHDADRILEVSVLIEGRLDLSVAESTNNTTIKTVHSTTTLWKKQPPRANRDHNGPESDMVMPSKCPNQLAFAMPLPKNYQDSTGTHPLPPTFQTLDFGQSGIFARSSYRLRITVKRTPKLGSGFSLLEKTKHIFIPFDYWPRTRSQQPISSCNGSLALIKMLPDQWYQSTSTIDVPSPRGKNAEFQPVTANIFVPDPRVYALSDSIPFHLQLSGRVDSLRALVAPDTLKDTLTSPNDTHTSSSRPTSFKPSTCIKKLQGEMSTSLRVFLLRQIRLEVKGKIRVQNVIIGEAQLEAVPPVMTDSYRLPVDCREEYISWTGTLKVGEGLEKLMREYPLLTHPDTKTGGFHAGSYLKVNDFVALSVGSSNPPWKDIRSSIGIKLVTESWDDGEEVEVPFF
ncbi:hypothetical protein CC1G_10585 [Coprinopsis cinerea okayama7|uniref:Arrestin-like N-terminal domain-containing protein n=1 Tax=Coprinopsis cinerea (strain Okayama-7 / 130 / ATCC MYA-4618 / FGSC 9003) TaxID=240176 RepID=A8NE00_COPC7|nr:hypothetical protein CC1G_10585 [Coprinopsis cinerea okayama7\|eukprot:XP_001832909.1 hypothetical protein CC1G_10585 [Coprinopsis cinerea okayama7\